MPNTLQQTMNFALPFIQYSPLMAGLGQEPAVSIASMIRSSLLNAGVGTWYWNRNSATVQLAKGQQDYVLFAEDFGYIEKATVTDDQGKIWELKEVRNIAPLSPSSELERPSTVAAFEGTSNLVGGGTVDTDGVAGSGNGTVADVTMPITSIAGEGLFAVTSINQISVTAGAPGNGWANNGFGGNMFSKVSAGDETFTQTLTPNGFFSSAFVSFRMQVPGTAPIHVQDTSISGSVSSPRVMTLTAGTSVGNGILVVFQVFNATQFSNISITDDKNNKYTQLAFRQDGTNETFVAIYWSPNVAIGTQVVTATFTGGGSGQVDAIEVSGVTSPLQYSPLLRYQGVPDQNYPASITYQKRAIGFGPWFATSVANESGGNTTYQGSFDPQALLPGSTVNITGFTNAVNNGSFTVVSCNSQALVVINPSGVAETNQGYMTNFSWAPVPDSFIDVYNNLFLAEAMALCDDARSQVYRARGVAAFLAKAQGLSETQKNVFVQQWLARSVESASTSLKVQQGVGARGQ